MIGPWKNSLPRGQIFELRFVVQHFPNALDSKKSLQFGLLHEGWKILQFLLHNSLELLNPFYICNMKATMPITLSNPWNCRPTKKSIFSCFLVFQSHTRGIKISRQVVLLWLVFPYHDQIWLKLDEYHLEGETTIQDILAFMLAQVGRSSSRSIFIGQSQLGLHFCKKSIRCSVEVIWRLITGNDK